MERRSKRTALKEGNNDSSEGHQQDAEVNIMEDNEQPSSKKAKTLEKEEDSKETSSPTSGKC